MSESTAPLVTSDVPSVGRWNPQEFAGVTGYARVDITPPVGIRAHNWGASRTGVATGVHRPLTATVMSVADGDGWRDIVTVDLGWWQSFALFSSVFDPLASAVGATHDSLLLHLVHTHAGPSLAEGDLGLEGSELVEPYRRALVDGLIDAVQRARQTATETTITWAYGRCSLAVSRDLACDQRDVLGFAPGLPADDTVAVGRVSAADGTVVATIVNYACHPTTLAHHNSLLSPDFIATTREIVEGETDAPCLFMQGASGDLSPRDQYLPGTQTAERNGRSLGYAVLSTLETMGTAGSQLEFTGVVESGAPLGIWEERRKAPARTNVYHRGDVRLETKPRPDAAALERQWAGIDPLAARERIARASRLAEGYDLGGYALHPVWLWTLGDALIVAQPGEAYSLLQTVLRERHPDRTILVLNLTNGPGTMYLPPRNSYARNRYQVWQTLLAEGSLETLIEAIDEMIESMVATAEGEPL